MKKKLLLLLLSSSLLFSACSFSHDKEAEDISYEDERELVEESLEDVPIETEEYKGDLTPLPIVKGVEQEESKSIYEFKKGDTDKYLTVTSNNAKYNPTLEDLKLVDEDNNEVKASLVSSSNGVGKYLIPVSSFDEDHQYHVKLNNDNLKFSTKDNSVRELTYYSLDVNDSNRVHEVVKSDNEFKNHDISNVQYFDVDAFGAYFIYDGEFSAKVGEFFRISDLSLEKDNKETVYGKVSKISNNPNGAGLFIRYEPCQGEDLYKNLDVNDKITVNEDNIENLELFGTEEETANELGKYFLHHEDIITMMMGMYHHYNISPRNYRSSAIDWAAHIKVAFDIKFDGDTFTWGCTITLDITPEKNFDVKLVLSYKQTTKYDISASLKIKWKWFIPTGVKYELKVEEDDTKEVKFKIAISTNLYPVDKEKIKEGIEKDLTEAFKKDNTVKSKFNGDSPTSSAAGQSYPLIRYDCYYFFPLDIRIEIDFYWQLQITVECDLTYTSHTHRTDVCINNNKGADPSSDTQTQKDKNLSFGFMGTFHAEVGIRASIGIGIAGFYKFFHAEVFIKAYGAVDAQGYLLSDLSWGSEQELICNQHCGGKFEVSVGVKWGVDVALLFGGFTSEWPIKSVILLGFCNANSIDAFEKEEETIEVNNEDYSKEKTITIDLDDYHLLGVRVFDSKLMTASHQDLKHNDSTKIRYGAFVSDYSKNYFECSLIDDGGGHIVYDDFKFSIKDISGVAEFTAKVQVKVTDECSSGVNEPVKIINIHFTNNNKQKIYIEDKIEGYHEYIGDYLMGTDMKLPVGVAPRYMKFVGWLNENTGETINYDPNDSNTGTYHVPDDEHLKPVYFKMLYIDYYYWNVVWVDGLGNIISIDNVYDKEAATAPDASIRDKYMISEDPNYEYVFIKWDKSFDCITQNTVIRGIYEYRKVGA